MTTATTITLPQIPGTGSLSHSSMSTFKTCRKKFWYSYILGLRRDRDQTALRMGSAIHLGLDHIAQGYTAEQAIAAVREGYAIMPKWVENGGPDAEYDWQIEQVKVEELLRGYAWRWRDDSITIVASETQFDHTINNPDTGGVSTVFHFAGKIDKVIRLNDGRLAVMEHKTTSEDIDPASGFWDRCVMDTQISGYSVAAKRMGHDVQTVLYDVIRKPTIKPSRATPMEVRKFKKDGTLYANQNERDETPDEYRARLHIDIEARPEFFYARREIPRTDGDLAEFTAELWDIQQDVRAAMNGDKWYRNTGSCKSNYGVCDYIDLCLQSFTADQGVPSGFVRLENVHPELAAPA